MKRLKYFEKFIRSLFVKIGKVLIVIARDQKIVVSDRGSRVVNAIPKLDRADVALYHRWIFAGDENDLPIFLIRIGQKRRPVAALLKILKRARALG